jgi:hypothetical protein
MSKRKRARSAKTRFAAKAKAARKQAVHHPQTRSNSKQARVLALLRGPNGATIASVVRATGWQQHTVRGFLAAVVRKKLGLTLEPAKTNGERVYRIAAGGNSTDSAGEPGSFSHAAILDRSGRHCGGSDVLSGWVRHPELPIAKSIRAAETALNNWYEHAKLAA